MADVQQRPENVGRILVKVQEDLLHLREQLSSAQNAKPDNGQSNTLQNINFHALEDAISRTEQGIKVNTEYVVNLINNQVTVLPTAGSPSRQGFREALPHDHAVQRALSSKQKPQTNRPILHPSVYHDSPGQYFQNNMTLKALLNPEDIFNRRALNRNYGLALPPIERKRESQQMNQSVAKGSTIEPLAVLPRQNRVNPLLPPPPIAEKDARKGILSLIERGLIPPAAELTLDPSPVHHKKVQIHDYDDIRSTKKQMHPDSTAYGEGSHHMASVKLDLSHGNRTNDTSQRLGTSIEALSPSVPPSSYSRTRSEGTHGRSPQMRSVLIQSPIISHSHRKSGASSENKTLKVKTFEAPLQPLPPPVTPAPKEDHQHVLSASQGYSFLLRNGALPDPPTSDPEFAAFKQRFLLHWGPIVGVLSQLQQLLNNYAIPLATVNGERLADSAAKYEIEINPTKEDLLNILENADEVAAALGSPGRRYYGPNGENVAALTIQATWRRHIARKAYLLYRKQRWAAGVIAISWIMHVRMTRMRTQLKDIRKMHLYNFRDRAKNLASDWARIRTSRRVVIHIPSLGYPAHLRYGLTNFNRKQNAQIMRLCELRDPNVDVIYISPVPIYDELEQYYKKLLGLRSAVDKEDPAMIEDLSHRFTVIVPEALNKFPTHHMCLGSLLKYSIKAMRRIQTLISGRDAYIVSGMMHKDDLAVADALNLPILGCEPEICHLYSSKSGSKRIFAAAETTVPPGEYDIYSLQQLHESLARLICENPLVRRWLMKTDMGFGGRGIAYLDLDKHLPSYKFVLKESARYGDKWTKKWAQDATYNKVLNELPQVLKRHGQAANKDVFKHWDNFIDAFLSQGGIIEAYPPSDSITCLSVDMMIDPTGVIHMLSCGDQIHTENTLACWGSSVPQASVDPEWLEVTCIKISTACRERGVVGHYTVDFVTYIDPDTSKQIIWATDLKLCYSDQLAMTQLMLFVSGGTFDPAKCHFQVPPPKPLKKSRFRRKDTVTAPPPNLNRFCVMSTNLLHTNMAVVHYSVFFQMCRAHGIGFDIKERIGSVFTLVDSAKRDTMGMITIGEDLQTSLMSFARGLSVIHQEISAPNMQGKTNFKAVIDDIKQILQITDENEDEIDTDSSDQKFQISLHHSKEEVKAITNG